MQSAKNKSFYPSSVSGLISPYFMSVRNDEQYPGFIHTCDLLPNCECDFFNWVNRNSNHNSNKTALQQDVYLPLVDRIPLAFSGERGQSFLLGVRDLPSQRRDMRPETPYPQEGTWNQTGRVKTLPSHNFVGGR